MVQRPIRHFYVDPLDAVWTATAERIGLRVVRSADVYAASDGRGTLTIGAPETLDPDDCLAQMIFHELCHSLVQGPASLAQRDFGLDNESERDVSREHACLRLQAELAGEHGLREWLAPTTDFRAFYDALGDEPFAPSDDEAVVLAREGHARAEQAPWGPHLRRALEATSAIARQVVAVGAHELTDAAGRPTLHSVVNPPRGTGSP
ncbi:MAG: hypothetical protein ACOCXM_06605 [Myxococcota bacterium]